ncbi:MAG: isoprenyl transferase [Lachnospiraceae bacterium]|nr:isoprenyl transferase [Lachnospiraceae bacterium]
MGNKENIPVVPKHVAIIMDGNGRWAKKRMLPRTSGHVKGAKVAEQTLQDADDLGIKYLTLYAFSTENWKRADSEVSFLMEILRKYLVGSVDKSMKNNVKVRVIGDRSVLSPELVDAIETLENATRENTGLNFTIAINYGGRDEIVRSVKNIAKDLKEGKISVEDINEELISSNLDTKEIPDPDLMIRTSGELRTSNFLPWQLAYSEFYFTDVMWPDFNMNELRKAVEYYGSRNRRFGGV